MSSHPSQYFAWPTPRGSVQIRSFCTPEEIRGYDFDSQFGSHAQYKSLYTRKETLENKAARAGADVVLALADERHIIGFGLLDAPEADDRWTALGGDVLREVRVIEVSRSWRAARVADGIMRAMMAHPRIGEIIVYMVGYSWTWDLDGTGKTAQQYRNMLIRLFTPHGFQELYTNEPNVCLKPENLFMARIGDQVDEETRQAFKWLRFGVMPE